MGIINKKEKKVDPMPNSSKKTNRLINEKSPYLLQHAHNPVDWFPWSNEAFTKAKEENKPIFLSIGYSTCHWCHVMERESFEDEEVATLLNTLFISIKVDREERPDVDAVYMSVCQAMLGQGGWPLTIIMTPEQQPFYAATYLPKKARNGQLGLTELLLRVSEIWKRDKSQLLLFSKDILETISKREIDESEVPTTSLLTEAMSQFKATFDPKYGGFSSAPKFPTPHNLLFLLRYGAFTNNIDALAMVETTLKQMFKGGIFDHIGGGFSRYSTDDAWLVPHFEKMLYDNALLLYTYVECYEKTRDAIYKQIAGRIITYVLRELTDPLGGFYCGQDADSDGVEGKYYVFTPDEIIAVLGKEQGEQFNNQFDITSNGNFEGKSIPNLLKNPRPFLYTKEDNFQPLYDYRKKRAKLHKDDKILTSWNGLMIAALAKASRILNVDSYLSAAKKADDFIKSYLMDGNKNLYVRYRDSDSAGEGKIDDYAFYAWALLELYETTYEISYLEDCILITECLITNFFDEDNGGCFLYSKEGEVLIRRPKEVYDGAIPSGNSVFSMILIQLYRLTGNPKWNDYSSKQLAFLTGHIKHYPAAYSFSLIAIQSELNPSKELICTVTDTSALSDIKELLTHKYLPNLTVIVKTKENSERLANIAPFTNDYPLPSKGACFYLCQNNTCSAPITDIKELETLIS